MGLFLVGSRTIDTSKLMDIAEELDEQRYISYDVPKAVRLLSNWQDEIERTRQRGGCVYGYTLEQCGLSSEPQKRFGAFVSTRIGNIVLGGINVLEGIYKLSEGIHPGDVREQQDWLRENVGTVLGQDLEFLVLTEKEEAHALGIISAAIRHLHRYKNPQFIPSSEYSHLVFIREAE